MITIWTALIVGAILYYFISLYLALRKLPPGPTPWPLIGNLGRELNPPFVFRGFEELAKKFGGMYTVHMPFPVVNITDYEILKEALKGDDLNGRYQNSVTELLTNDVPNGGIVTSDGPFWRDQRRLAISVLRDLGMGRNLMEEKIQLALRDYITYLKEHPKLDAIDMHFPIHVLVANIINDFIFGIRYTYKTADPLIEYLDEVDTVIREFGKSSLFLATARFPIIRKIPLLRWYAYDRYKPRFNKMYDYIHNHIALARKSFHPEDEPANYVHAFLKKARDDPSMTDAQLASCCSDLFLAGQETTITTSKWGIIFMAAYPKVQERIREEVRAVTGNARMPSYADKTKMPFTVATLHEIQRCGNIIALAPILMHRAVQDVVINGHSFAKDTVFHADYHHVMAHDPHFVEPEKFNPDRYLMEDGVTLRKELVERTVPFGMGKRQCAGEGLARMELFLGLTTTVQNFHILPPIGGKVDTEPEYTGGMHPSRHQNVKLIPIKLEY